MFLDTRKEGEQATLVAGRGTFADRLCHTGYRIMRFWASVDHPCTVDSSLQGAGLSLAIAQMRKGEIASLEVEPQYGYGAQGEFSQLMLLCESCCC